jgi:hypothetical protein
MRIAGIDPGKQKDSFFFVGTEIKDKKIYVLGAREWKGRAYLDVENDISGIHEKKPFDYYVVERNNTGEHVIEVLTRNHNLPVLPVFTTRDIKDPKKIYSPRMMDKMEMVKFMLILINDHRLVFPTPPTPETRELERQMSIFAEHKTELTGKVSYQAEGSEHDDAVMALMLACFIGRLYIDRQEGKKKMATASKRFGPTDEDVLGSGVPEEYNVQQRYVWNP